MASPLSFGPKDNILNIELIGMRPNPQGGRTRTDLPAAVSGPDTHLGVLSAAIPATQQQANPQSSALANPRDLGPY